VGTPMALYEKPANLFVAQFIGSPRMNVLACAAQADGRVRLAGQDSLRPPAAGPQARWLGVRPEHVALAPPGEGHVEGRVELIENLGADVFLHVDAGEAGVLVARTATAPLRMGEKVALRLEEGRCHLFDAAGKALSPEAQ
jgi:multiple sugar transport system ATP-binding protein